MTKSQGASCEYEVKLAIKDDFLEIAKLDRDVWLGRSDIDFIPDGEHVWRLWVEYSNVFVAIDVKTQKIVGATIAYRADANDLVVFHKTFVTKEARGHGIGQRLFTARYKKAVEYAKIAILTTSLDNTAMQKICEQFDVIDKTLVKGYYRDSEDRFIFRFRL